MWCMKKHMRKMRVIDRIRRTNWRKKIGTPNKSFLLKSSKNCSLTNAPNLLKLAIQPLVPLENPSLNAISIYLPEGSMIFKTA